ncbi:hypothetical protein QBC35DRAFT_471792 [Podospora australis]|uniref:Uncharacterized protein n=1 Tax=Podospora australis TaxID=1536484 RepID=A0AAN6WZ98_9PEZI|nr:hypothetical protein QBC35DRAFT_471792 [Podospora australis]
MGTRNSKPPSPTPITTKPPSSAPLTRFAASRIEIVLIALGIFLLVVQLLGVLWFAFRRRSGLSLFYSTSTSTTSTTSSGRDHSRPSSPCLFKEAFPEALSHEPLLSSSSSLAARHNNREDRVQHRGKRSFLERFRKASEDIANAVQYELMELGRRVSAHGRAVASVSRRGSREPERVRDEEFGLMNGQQRDQGFDGSGWRDPCYPIENDDMAIATGVMTRTN